MRAGSGYLHGIIVAGGFDDEEASKDLLGLAEGSFGDEELTVLGAKAAAGSVDQLLATAEDVAFDESLAPGNVSGDECLDLFGGQVVEAVFGLAEQKGVFGHGCVSCAGCWLKPSSLQTIEWGEIRQ